MTFSEAVRSVLSRYATFPGRARRAEYWWFYLFTFLVSIAAAIVDALLNVPFNNEWGAVGIVASLVLLLPSIAVTARRLHDTGRSGWWMLLPVIPTFAVVMSVVGMFFALFDSPGDTVSAAFVPEASDVAALLAVLAFVLGVLSLGGWITLLVFLCLDSKSGSNRYGPSPKYPAPPAGPGGFYPPAGYGGPLPQPSPHGYPSPPPLPSGQGYHSPQP